MPNTNQDLLNHVNDIARRISEADFDRNDDGDECSAFDYLQDALDIEYIVASDKKTLLGARVLVAFGGPNIWINTRTKQVEGYWWGDSCVMSYSNDEMGIDDAVGELWACR